MSYNSKDEEETLIPCWIDCDPGHDDFSAIILAGHSPKLRLLGISTVFGNQSVEKTTENALKCIEVSGLKHLEVVSGASKPLVKEAKLCPEIHGETGLDGATFPPLSKRPLSENAILHIFQTIKRQHPKKVTIIATAVLTNIALLLSTFPDVKDHINQIVLMGGAIGAGNMSAAAEFNIEGDAEAAIIVFESGVPVVMVPLEVTHTVLVTDEITKKIQTVLENSKFSKLVIALMVYFQKSYKELFGFLYPPLHDPVAVAFCIDPSLFEKKLMRVDVDNGSTGSYGRTNCDIFGMSKRKKNVIVATKVDVDGFFKLFLDALVIANKYSLLNN